jgi:hypothetical protein
VEGSNLERTRKGKAKAACSGEEASPFRSIRSINQASSPTQTTAGLGTNQNIESSLVVPKRLPQNTEVGALCFFFTGYVTIARDPQTSRGFLEYLLPLYSNAPHDSPISQATSALAIMLASMWSRKGIETEESRRFFGKALAMTKAAIDDPQQNTTDETLMTVLLLEFYESCNSRFRSEVSSGTHNAGAIALVKHRGSLNFQNETSKRLLIALRNQLIGVALQRGELVTPDPAVWTDTAPMPQSPAIELDKVCAELANLQARYKRFAFPLIEPPDSITTSPPSFNASASSIEVLHSILAPALQLEMRLSLWSRSVPLFWHPIAVSSPDSIHPSIQSAGLYSYACDVYPCLHVAHVWNTYRITRLAVLKIILVCQSVLTRLQSATDYPTTRQYTLDIVQKLVDAVCASVPYHLGNRVGPSPFDSIEGVEYPHLRDDDTDNYQVLPPNALGYSMQTSREDHIRVASAKGGWYILDLLEKVLGATTFDISEVAESGILPPLREGQREWIVEQLQRTRSMYLIRSPAPSPST